MNMIKGHSEEIDVAMEDMEVERLWSKTRQFSCAKGADDFPRCNSVIVEAGIWGPDRFRRGSSFTSSFYIRE